MSRAPKLFRFETEAAMCAAFIKVADEAGWQAYPETGGFDILLVHRETRLQLGVEAKQRLNIEVVHQAIEHVRRAPEHGPDFHAVLVPEGGVEGMSGLLGLVGITTIRAKSETKFWPHLPELWELQAIQPGQHSYWWERDQWPQHFPAQQCKVPDYVPDVIAGAPCPVTLTEWKVRAIKIAVLLERRGAVSGDDFKALKISMSRWTQSGWIKPIRRGVWQAGKLPNFRAQHPVNFDQIAADFDSWSAALPKPPADLFVGEVAA